MAQRIFQERPTTLGLGVQPADFADGEGEEVGDDELMGSSDAESASTAPGPRVSLPRVSQRIPRLSLSDPAADEGGILVGRYRVERVLSRTPHEVVVEATHLELAQRVLLRHLTTLAGASPEAAARFQRGARKAREMRSEHAERVVDFGRLESGAPYRAVELPHGPSLAEIVRVRGPLPVSEAVDIVLTACEPVAEAHAAGVAHRSLTTSNIFVERRPDGTPLVRVLDFGVTDPLEPGWVDDDEGPTPAAGLSPERLRFASPEQIRNPGAVDARADVWALGVILYELLAGAPLYGADNPFTLLAMIAADPPTPLGLLRTDIPPDLDETVLGCLEKDPAARPASVVDVVFALAPHASVEAQQASERVARIIVRTTRPPPLTGRSRPPLPLGAPAPSRALVRSRAPSARTLESVAAPRSDLRSVGMLLAGAAIGLGSAGLARISAPTPPASPTPAEVAAATPASRPAPVVAPVSPIAAAPAEIPVQAAPSRVAPRPTAERAPATRALSADERASVRPAPARPAARPIKARESTEAEKTASADDLFGGID